MDRLKGKVAVITGAGSGLGKCSAELFAAEGAKVVVADIVADAGEAVVKKIKSAGNEAVFFKCDVSKADEVEAMVEFTVNTYGKLDILYNNAGYTGPHLDLDIAHQDLKDMDKVFDINLKGTYYGIHYAAPYMVNNGGGSIISTASAAGVIGCMGGTYYGVSKSAVIGLTVTAANELGRHKVRVNCVSPYVMHTPFLDILAKTPEGRKELEMFKSGNPCGRVVEPFEVAYTALFLATDESSAITGQNIMVDLGACVQAQPYDAESWNEKNMY